MKAYQIKIKGFPPGIYAAASASKAKAIAIGGLLNYGYAPKWKDAISLIDGCFRRPDLDKWAEQFNMPTSKDIDFVCCDLHPLPEPRWKT